MSLWAERNIPSKSKDYGKNTCKCRGKNVNLRLKMNISSLSKYDMIADRITVETHRGVTVLDGEGWYSHGDVKVLIVLAYKRQSQHIFKIVKSIDPNAFISQSSVIGVYGEGFDKIKAKV